MTRNALVGLCTTLLACAPLAAGQPPPTLGFVNGRVFDGQAFQTRDFYVSGGVLATPAPERVDEVIDLQGGFVVPPFADAHTHNFDTAFGANALIRRYLAAGIFYAKVQTDPRSLAMRVAPLVNRPDSVDVSYAHGALTSSYGHGVEVYEGLALLRRPGGFSPEEVQRVRASRLRENDAYYIIDSDADLEAKWPLVLAGRPDFVKIYLQKSEDHAALIKRTDTVGDRGIAPELAPLVVAKAHAAGLRVSAHVATRHDYQVALRAGVDEMAHIPDYPGAGDGPARYELNDSDAAETARRGIVVVLAPVVAPQLTPGNPSYDAGVKERVDRVRRHNHSLLKQHGVKIAAGSDRYGSLVTEDVMYLSRLGVFTNAELLRIWTETTPQAIFPSRRIGRLADGFEASFLVLDKNPLEDFSNVGAIRLRMKQGLRFDPAQFK